MLSKNLRIAERYYTLMGENNVEGFEEYIHSDVEFVAPLAKLKGKEEFLEAAKKYASNLDSLTIREKFGSEDQALIIYDFTMPGAPGVHPTAALLNFDNGLICRVELIYDARPLV